MPRLTINVTDESMKELEKQAIAASTSPEKRAEHHLELILADTRRFPDGVIKAGCERIILVLKRIPGLHSFFWTGFAFRHWRVRCKINTSQPHGWDAVRKLGAWINSEASEMMLYASFLPMPSLRDSESIDAEICSTEPMWDPGDLASWLETCINKKGL